MSERVDSAIATPSCRKTVRQCASFLSPWLHRETAFVLLGTLLCTMPLYVAADPDEYRLQPNGHRINAPNSTTGVELGRVLERLQDAPRIIQTYAVNSYFNTFGYRSDPELWKRPDHWASPVEFLARRAGDCEDFAIAKYFALRALGIPDDQIFLAYVYDISINASHMIVIYDRPGAPALVLDNRSSLIHSLSEHKDLVPIYGFNATGAFLLPASVQPWIRPQRRISFFHPQWADILRQVPAVDVVRPRAKAPIPAALKAPSRF